MAVSFPYDRTLFIFLSYLAHHFIYSVKKSAVNYCSELINLNYTFNIPFKKSLKTIIIEDTSQFYDRVNLKILAILLQVFLSGVFQIAERRFFMKTNMTKITYSPIVKATLFFISTR